ncbi:hypothetical protein V5799_011777 [Amblyomma americanum]|uniref:Uncharacterized protein n=1 Tax=Amblyomma americanum TaxID=6943 RepID=A0AAQ4EFX0_AMBAM
METPTTSVDQNGGASSSSSESANPLADLGAYFSSPAKRGYATWEEVELELHISGPYVSSSCFIEVCIAESMKQATLIPYDKWVQLTIPDTFNIFITQDHKIKLDCEYLARFLHEGIAVAISEAFAFNEGDNTDELFVLGVKELRDLTVYRKHLRVCQAKLSQAEKQLREERRAWAKEREVNQLNEALVWELKQGIAAKNAEYLRALTETAAKYRKEVEVKEAAISSLRKMLDVSAKQYDALAVNYKLQQEALENVQEQLSAQESTKALLHGEIKSLQESRARFAMKALNVMTENDSLKESIEKLSQKPVVSDSSVSTLDEDETFDNEVNNNVILSASAAKELEDKVKEMMARLNAAADEYTQLYRKFKRQEKLTALCQCAGKNDRHPAARLSSSNPQLMSLARMVSPGTLAPKKVSASVPGIAELKEVAVGHPSALLVDLSWQFQPNFSDTAACQECPATVGTACTSDASYHGRARPKTTAAALVVPTCIKSRKVAVAPTAWRRSPLSRGSRYAAQCRQGWNLPSAPPPQGFGRDACLKDTAAQTELTTTADSAAQVEADTATASLARPGEAEAAEHDGHFVAIEMPEASGESTLTTASEPVSKTGHACVLCTEVVPDLEQHLRDVHQQQPCPVCNCLFDATLPSTYLETHIEDHFTPWSLD